MTCPDATAGLKRRYWGVCGFESPHVNGVLAHRSEKKRDFFCCMAFSAEIDDDADDFAVGYMGDDNFGDFGGFDDFVF